MAGTKTGLFCAASPRVCAPSSASCGLSGDCGGGERHGLIVIKTTGRRYESGKEKDGKYSSVWHRNEYVKGAIECGKNGKVR